MHSIFILCFYIIFINSNAFKSISDKAFILYSETEGHIWKAYLNNENKSIISNKREIVFHRYYSEQSYGIGYSLTGNLLLWNNKASNLAAPLDKRLKNSIGINEKIMLNKQKLHDLARIAFDWIHNLLYFTDSTEIHVISIMNTNLRYVVIDNAFDVIRNIAIDPLESFIFWIQWEDNLNNYKMMRSYEDGSDIKVMVNSSFKYSYGMALDLQHKTVYWIDAELYTLSSIDYNGNNRRLILKSIDLFSKSYRMDFFEDYIFWFNDIYKSFMKTHKSGLNGTARLTVIKSKFSVEAMKIVHPLRQPFSANRCLNSNCSHLCLPNGINSFRCLCPSIRYYKFRVHEKCNPQDIKGKSFNTSDSTEQNLCESSTTPLIPTLSSEETSINITNSREQKLCDCFITPSLPTRSSEETSFNTSDSTKQKLFNSSSCLSVLTGLLMMALIIEFAVIVFLFLKYINYDYSYFRRISSIASFDLSKIKKFCQSIIMKIGSSSSTDSQQWVIRVSNGSLKCEPIS